MDGSIHIPFEVFNALLLALFAVVPIVALVITANPEWGDARVAQLSLRARLPLGQDTTRRSLRQRSRALLRANMWGLLATMLVFGSITFLTPLGTSPFMGWFLALAILFVVVTGCSAIVTTRERLFSPAPAAPRVARAQTLTVREYVGRWRAALPIVLLVCAAILGVAAGIAIILGAIPRSYAPWLAATGALAVAATVAGWAIERRILAQPQPASDTLELAWDDLFRTDALATLRMGAAMVAWLPVGLATALLVLAAIPFATAESILGLFPWFGIPLLQVIYAIGQNRLAPRLYPDFLRTGPATA
ncbi:hypothetical protein ACFQZV_10735 [Microbacterium koreense]|uniref:Uncharacterized protein n=1 Tax=Microbacterium koreense TaxID=323761 RepID=A0ABW2ZTJ8_9MICO